METKFNFNSQVCTDKNQSERLLALGLKKETADMRGVEGIEHTPTYAWSLHRLLSLYNLHYIEFMNEEEIESVYDIVIDAMEQAIKEGYFNKEYLED
jgi:hypothetical protein